MNLILLPVAPNAYVSVLWDSLGQTPLFGVGSGDIAAGGLTGYGWKMCFAGLVVTLIRLD